MPKRRATKTPSNVAKRSRVAVTLDVKLDIVKRHEHGERTSVIGGVHGLAPSTVHSIVKSADKIKEMAGSTTPMTATKVTRFRDAEMESMERIDNSEVTDDPGSEESEVADAPGNEESEVADDPGNEESELADFAGSEKESEVADDSSLLSPQ
ncbi:CENPB DNA-binding domain containing protein 1-like 12 [Homarus americanus]|uniref:CENPB DNA-binding domain containing protein 1-like 12 n=1 Tax=Homarus americanus TaxID=6706 RepID=A0A8J5MQ49_HOMAM|nr:CENPB DNA-binding domain containing protein 1-like 12 [Homarus americanus]